MADGRQTHSCYCVTKFRFDLILKREFTHLDFKFVVGGQNTPHLKVCSNGFWSNEDKLTIEGDGCHPSKNLPVATVVYLIISSTKIITTASATLPVAV